MIYEHEIITQKLGSEINFLTNIKNQAVLFTVVSWAAAAIAFWMFADFANPGPTILRITFIGLAALTVPHMILIDGISKNKLANNKINS